MSYEWYCIKCGIKLIKKILFECPKCKAKFEHKENKNKNKNG